MRKYNQYMNELGASVKTLESGNFEPGTYLHEINTESLVSGVYLFRLSSDSVSSTKRLLISK